jgi:hypothetical protein
MADAVIRLSQRNLFYARTHLEDIDPARICAQPAGVHCRSAAGPL